MSENNYIRKNKDLWNSRTDVHVNSEFYDMPSFLKGKNTLNSIELDLLGDVKDKNILHLQCHFGQDTLSLARMGAKATGADLSDKAIKKANDLAKELGLDAKFVCCDIYELPKNLDEKFDIVFTSYGTIGWLPDLDKWAAVIKNHLKPGGRFIMVDFHPVVWMFDNDFKEVGYNYFNTGAINEVEEGTYADRDAKLHSEYVGWNHSMAELLSALLNIGLTLKTFQEIDYSPYNCFRHTEEFEPGKFRIKHLENKIPMVYAIEAVAM